MSASDFGDDATRSHLPFAAGDQVAQYTIVEKIGAGGMGEVYLAEDRRLKRRVALKFLPLQLCSDSDLKQRFRREAEATARLSHPNVVVIHDVGEYHDRPYFAMEHVEGRPLRDIVMQEKLEILRILELIIGICDGLGAAHDRKVIHRDIKPSNIVIDSYGRPKILDFGLAAIEGTEQLTRTGSTLGTVRYMSPEQALGRPIDQRSDLFSLGIVLYELVAGRTPFERATEASTLQAITSEKPEPLARYRAGVPDDLERIVTRLLDRDPSRRYQTAADLRADLARLTVSAPAGVTAVKSPEESIMVVPFENHGGDADSDYFSDGLTEEIITDLGKIGHVRVISRKSSMQLKGTDKDVRTLGREFGVMYVLTGSVRRIGENVRVNTELVEASSERQIWAERYTGALKDVLDIQEEIARAIASALKVSLSVSEETALADRSIKNVRAYDMYLRARQETGRWNKEGLDRAHELLDEALKLEPESAALHAALGYNYYNYVNMGFDQEAAIEKSMNCVERAFEIDPDSTDAMRLRGIIYVSLMGQAEEGLSLLKRVLDKSPQDTEAMWWLALGNSFRGRPERSVEMAERLIQIEPFVIMNQMVLAWSHYMNGSFARALEEIDAAHRKEPDSALVAFTRTLILFYNARLEEAYAFIEFADSGGSPSFFERLLLVQLYASKGNRDKVVEVMSDDFQTTARRDIQYPWHIAVAMTLLGDHDEAIRWLSVAIDKGFSNHRFLEEHDPYLKPLRDDPRFKVLVERARSNAKSMADK